jgi:transcriptional regulator
MHPNPKFHIKDREAMAAIVRRIGFGLLAVGTEEGLRAVHVPLLLQDDRLRFHVSRGNKVHAALLAGAEALVVVNGPDAYVSPDWYGLPDRVPTWNYVAVEMNGRASALGADALVRLMDDLSAEHEERLAPKAPWTRAKMDPARFEGLLKAITGFEMEIAGWRGTAKLDQDKPQAVRDRVADAMAEAGWADAADLVRAPTRVAGGIAAPPSATPEPQA